MDVECDGARASVEIVEEIIDNVRPWSRAKAAVYNGVVNELSGLLMVQEIRRNRLSRGTESKKAIRELEPALRVLIDIVNRVPAKFLASRERSELLGILQTLRARLEHRRQVIKRLPKNTTSQKIGAPSLPTRSSKGSRTGHRRGQSTAR
jgi:hypothetical protein